MGKRKKKGNQEKTSLPNSPLNLGDDSAVEDVLISPVVEPTKILENIEDQNPNLSESSNEKPKSFSQKLKDRKTDEQKKEDKEKLEALGTGIQDLEKVIEVNANSIKSEKAEEQPTMVPSQEESKKQDEALLNAGKSEKVEEEVKQDVEVDAGNSEKKEEQPIVQQEEEQSKEVVLPANEGNKAEITDQHVVALDASDVVEEKIVNPKEEVVTAQPVVDAQAKSDEKKEVELEDVKQEPAIVLSSDESSPKQQSVKEEITEINAGTKEEAKEEAKISFGHISGAPYSSYDAAAKALGVTDDVPSNSPINLPFGAGTEPQQASVFLSFGEAEEIGNQNNVPEDNKDKSGIIESTDNNTQESKKDALSAGNPSESLKQEKSSIIPKATVEDDKDLEDDEEVVEDIGLDGKKKPLIEKGEKKPRDGEGIPLLTDPEDNSVHSTKDGVEEGEETTTKPAADPKPVEKNGENDAEKEKANKNQPVALSQAQQQEENKKKMKKFLIIGGVAGGVAVGYAAALKLLSDSIKNIWFDRVMIAGTVISSMVSAGFFTKALIESKNVYKRSKVLNTDNVENRSEEKGVEK